MSSSQKLSRRDFLRTAAAAGAGLGLATTATFGVAQEDKVVNMVGWGGDVPPEFMAAVSEETGIQINYDALPPVWNDVMAKITLWGQTGFDGIDVLWADDLIGGLWGMNGWAEDMTNTNAWQDNKDDVVDNVHVLNEAVGGVFRLFYFLGLEPFMYNKDLVPEPPTTWEELFSIGEAVTDQENGVWGWHPRTEGGHAFNTVLLALNHAGGDLSTLADENSLTAFQFMQDWIKRGISSPTIISENNFGLAAAGKVGMWWNYEGNYNSLLTVEDTVFTEENLGLARFPAGPGSDVGLVHGWGYSVPTAGQNKATALELMDVLATRDKMKEISVRYSGLVPAMNSLIEDEEIIALAKVLSAGPGWAEMLRGAKFREPIVNSPQTTQLWQMFELLGQQTLALELTPEEVQEWAVAEYDIINMGI